MPRKIEIKISVSKFTLYKYFKLEKKMKIHKLLINNIEYRFLLVFFFNINVK